MGPGSSISGAWLTSKFLMSFFLRALLAAAFVAERRSSAAERRLACWLESWGWLAQPYKQQQHRVTLEILVWIYHTYGFNFDIEKDFTKYLRESYG